MGNPKKLEVKKPVVRDENDRGVLSKICEWWDHDRDVSLICFAMRDHETGDGAEAKTMITTSPHHALEIIYQVAKVIKCNCGDPTCPITESAAAVVATLELNMGTTDGGKVALH